MSNFIFGKTTQLILYILEYYSYLCRPIYIVLLWESLINIRLN